MNSMWWIIEREFICPQRFIPIVGPIFASEVDAKRR